MCGIAGFVSEQRELSEMRIQSILQDMGSSMQHRGPDADGIWYDQSKRVGLSHKRLAINDLSSAGSQPMVSPSGKSVLILNGEIYNFKDLRLDLRHIGHEFRGGSDTEVLLTAIETWGLEQTLRRVHGMFAFALVDRQAKRLYLARDRLGEKPLYYSLMSGTLMFASELKALTATPWWNGEICHEAAAEYFAFNYVPEPLSIYRNTFKLPAGHFMSVELDRPRYPELHEYWSISSSVDPVAESEKRRDPVEYLDEFEARLAASVRRQLIADVPIGTFLSGGIDSSLITALAQRESNEPVKSFTVSFNESAYDESKDAAKLANALGTEHTEIQLSLDAALELIPTIHDIYDEPFGDSSALPTILVSKAARKSVTVILGGDGADELQSGYARYSKALDGGLLQQTSGPRSRMKLQFMRLVRSVLNLPLAARVDPIRKRKLSRRIDSMSEKLRLRSDEAIYRRSVQFWLDGRNPIGGQHRAPKSGIVPEPMWTLDPLKSMMLFDSQTYLPGDILTKVDRAAMSVSLETRLPYLDHELVQTCMVCPSAIHRMDGKPKWMSRELLRKMLPELSFERPKMGFAIPIDEWLRGPLRSWAASLLDPERLRGQSILDSQPIIEEWDMHLSGAMNRGQSLWGVLMFLDFIEKASAK